MKKMKIVWVERSPKYINFFIEFNGLEGLVECEHYYNFKDALENLSKTNDTSFVFSNFLYDNDFDGAYGYKTLNPNSNAFLFFDECKRINQNLNFILITWCNDMTKYQDKFKNINYVHKSNNDKVADLIKSKMHESNL